MTVILGATIACNRNDEEHKRANTDSELVTACRTVPPDQREANQRLVIPVRSFIVNRPDIRRYPHGLCSSVGCLMNILEDRPEI